MNQQVIVRYVSRDVYHVLEYPYVVAVGMGTCWIFLFVYYVIV